MSFGEVFVISDRFTELREKWTIFLENICEYFMQIPEKYSQNIAIQKICKFGTNSCKMCEALQSGVH